MPAFMVFISKLWRSAFSPDAYLDLLVRFKSGNLGLQCCVQPIFHRRSAAYLHGQFIPVRYHTSSASITPLLGILRGPERSGAANFNSRIRCTILCLGERARRSRLQSKDKKAQSMGSSDFNKSVGTKLCAWKGRR